MSTVFRRILEHKVFILILFLASAILSLLFAQTVKVNYNLADYLPDDAPSTIGLKVMEDEFDQEVPNARVMISNVTIPQALEVKKQLESIDGVEEVNWLDDAVDVTIPLEMLDKDTVESFYKCHNAIYSVTLDSSKQVTALQQVRSMIGENGAISGASVNTVTATTSTGAEISKIMMIAIPIVFFILLLTTSSWFEPVLFLFTIGIAIALNMGTNAIFGEISFVTKAAGSILQLAVSMDYSIFLLHRFSEFRSEGLDVQTAMLKALNKSFSSIIASGITTIIGFAALILMRFKIGPDMGWIMAKGIFFSLISVLVLLPVLSILSYLVIDKTQHHSFIPEFKHFQYIVAKAKVPAIILFVMLTVPAFLAQSNNSYYYGSSHIFKDETTQLVQDRNRIESTFGKSNQMVLLLPKGSMANERLISDALKDIKEVSSVISYVDSVGAEIPTEYVPKSKLSKLISQNYSRMILTIKADYEGAKTFQIVKSIQDIAGKSYGDSYYLVGESANTYDMRDVTSADSTRVNMIAIGAVAIILLLTFRSASLPIILLLVIESSVWLNLSIPYFMDNSLFFIASLIISSVQLGATVDYAILFTNRYIENRIMLDKKEALKQTVADTTISIVTSALILTVCGTVLGLISSNEVLGQLGTLIGRGALFSAIFVLFLLPALLNVFDSFIQRTTMNLHFLQERSVSK